MFNNERDKMKQKEPLLDISLTLTQLYGLSVLIHEHRRITDTIKWGANGEKKQGAGILDDIITDAIVSYEHKQLINSKQQSKDYKKLSTYNL